ncbi:MAG: DMT family transporter [Pseudomonadota bacterium]
MTLRLSTAQTGLVLMVAGSAVDSTSGLFTRLAGADGFTTASARGFFAFAVMFGYLVWREGRNTPRRLLGIGGAGAAFVLINALGMISNMISLANTAVANFYMIFATAPFAAAVAARLVLRERTDMATLLAAMAGFAGIAVMMASGTRSGGLSGDLVAVGSVASFAMLALVVRRNPGIDLPPVIALGVLASALLSLPFAAFGSLQPGQWGLLAAFGLFQLALGNVLVFAAMSRIPPAQSGLLGILNAAFAPLWVFAALGEVPSPATLTGGGIILAAAVLHLVWTLTRRAASAAAG